MFGIYKYENGLEFTGMIAESVADAEKYLENTYGSYENRYTGKRNSNNEPIYEEVFVPKYNKEVFKIIPVLVVK